MRLRPLLLVSGKIHLDGGSLSHRRSKTRRKKSGEKSDRVKIVQEVEISEARRRGNSLSTSGYRDLGDLTIVRTPWGWLVDPANKSDLDAFLDRLTELISEFATEYPTGCRLANYLVYEQLSGTRQAAIEGWLARKSREGDAEVREKLVMLEAA